MAIQGTVHPFFCEVQNDLKELNDEPDKAKEKVLTSDPVFYQKTLFRSFLHLTKEECDEMGIDEYIKYNVMLTEHLKLLHAPYMEHKESI